jgi:hypothetical protein
VDEDEEMVETANGLLDAADGLEAKLGVEIARRYILKRVTRVDGVSRVDLGGGAALSVTPRGDRVTHSPNRVTARPRRQAENVPLATMGVAPSDSALVAMVRWAVTQWIIDATRGHFGLVIADGAVRAVASDPTGGTLLRIAERLTRVKPRSALVSARRTNCAWCDVEITYLRKTKKFCSDRCQQANKSAQRRDQQESKK